MSVLEHCCPSAWLENTAQPLGWERPGWDTPGWDPLGWDPRQHRLRSLAVPQGTRLAPAVGHSRDPRCSSPSPWGRSHHARSELRFLS